MNVGASRQTELDYMLFLGGADASPLRFGGLGYFVGDRLFTAFCKEFANTNFPMLIRGMCQTESSPGLSCPRLTGTLEIGWSSP